MSRHIIAVDWGTTRFRAYLVDPNGSVVEKREAERGVLTVAPGEFGTALHDEIGSWRRAHPELPIVASGMVGSRQGWVEAPYVSCPAGLADLTAGVTMIEDNRVGPVAVVPGLTCRDSDGVPDVMRGEETQIIGGAAALGAGTQVFVLPGTHCKWAIVRDGIVETFTTYMTGELFAILRHHSILGRLMSGSRSDETAFARGVAAGTVRKAAGLLHQLFSARTLGLFDELPTRSLESYLSGLLIGTEIANATTAIGELLNSVTLVSGAGVGAPYAEALRQSGIGVTQMGDEATVRGLSRIADHLARSNS
jgi:2-dehydro-3-deoxygalactonokinase